MPIFRSDPDELDELDESPAPPPLPNDPRLAIAPDNHMYVVLPTGSYWIATSGEKSMASIIDTFLVLLCSIGPAFLLLPILAIHDLYRALFLFLSIVYFLLMFHFKGRTVGHLVTGLDFITLDGDKPRAWLSFGSYFYWGANVGYVYTVKVSKNGPPPPSSRPNVVQPTEYRQQPQPSHNPPAPRKFVYESRRVVVSNKDYKATSSQDEPNEQR